MPIYFCHEFKLSKNLFVLYFDSDNYEPIISLLRINIIIIQNEIHWKDKKYWILYLHIRKFATRTQFRKNGRNFIRNLLKELEIGKDSHEIGNERLYSDLWL